jgi:hypothetical protein
MFARPAAFGAILLACQILSPTVAAQVVDGLTAPEAGEAAQNLAGFRPEARPDHMLRYPVVVQTGAEVRPEARLDVLPAARWDDRPDGALWTRAALSAMRTDAPDLAEVVPRDIEAWCPAYETNPAHLRQAFWVGVLSALSQYESGHRPDAVGGGGRWFGLMQINPATARGYDCSAQTGEGLTDPEANLSCAARIFNVTVARDQAVALHDGRWRGVAADWGPMASETKRNAMASWTREQSYCQRASVLAGVSRPVARPAPRTIVATMSTSNPLAPSN